MPDQADARGECSGPGYQATNLFDLEPERTPTLFNGRWMVTSGCGIAYRRLRRSRPR